MLKRTNHFCSLSPDTEIRDKGGVALGEALKTNSSITKLDLRCEEKTSNKRMKNIKKSFPICD